MTPPIPSRSPWLFGRNVDLGVFLAAPLASIVLVGVGHCVGIRELPTWAFLAFVVGIDVAHVHATLYRVYLDPVEVRRRKWLYLGMPLVVYAAGVSLYVTSGALWFWRALAYVAVFHFIRQQAGWVALYRRREPSATRLDQALDTLTIYAVTIAPLVHWHAHLPRQFSWFVAGDFVTGVLRPWDRRAMASELVVLALFVARQLVRARRESLAVGRLIVVAGTAITWWVGIVASDDDFSFTLTNVIPHGIPYFALTFMYARARFQSPCMRAAPDWGVHRLVAAGVGAMGAFLVALAIGEELLWDRLVWHEHENLFGHAATLPNVAVALLVPLLSLPQAVHYILDGIVWRQRGNPTLNGIV